MKLLVNYSSNWADEMDIEGFTIMTEEEYNEWETFFKEKFEDGDHGGSYTFYIGTNEEIEYESWEEFERDFTVDEISDEDAKVIETTLVLPYGFFPEVH